MFRGIPAGPEAGTGGIQFHFPESEVATVKVGKDSYLVGKSLSEVALRSEYGVTLLAVRRGGEALPNPGAAFVFEKEDQLIVFGNPHQVADAAALARGADPMER